MPVGRHVPESDNDMIFALIGDSLNPLADAVRQLKLVPQSRYDDAAAFFG